MYYHITHIGKTKHTNLKGLLTLTFVYKTIHELRMLKNDWIFPVFKVMCLLCLQLFSVQLDWNAVTGRQKSTCRQESLSNLNSSYGAFSCDVTAAMLVFQKDPAGVELFSILMLTLSFVRIIYNYPPKGRWIVMISIYTLSDLGNSSILIG